MCSSNLYQTKKKRIQFGMIFPLCSSLIAQTKFPGTSISGGCLLNITLRVHEDVLYKLAEKSLLQPANMFVRGCTRVNINTV